MAKKLNLQTDEAVAEIKKLIRELKSLDNTLGKMSQGNVAAFNKMTSSMAGFRTTITQLNNSINRLSGITKTNSQNLTRNSNEIKRNSDLTKTLSRNTRQQTRATVEQTKALKGNTTGTNQNTSAKKNNTKAGSGMLKMMGRMMGALGFVGLITLLGQTVKSIISLTIRFQSLGYAIDKIAGENFAEIKRSWEFLIELNQNFGAKLSDTTERWLKFRAAASQSNLTLKDTMNIFRSVTKASAVLGLGTEELKGVYLALEQMLSKGKVTTEELRRQLGERLPGAMGIMAKAVGVSIEELDKMMKKGELLSSYALPRFAKALEEAYGIESLKTVENLATGVGKMAGAWDRFVMTISEGDSIISKSIGGTMKLITTALDRLTNFLETYEQTANRTSGAKYGREVKMWLDKEIESRMLKNKSIQETIKLLSEERKEALDAGDMKKYQELTLKVNEAYGKQTEAHYRAILTQKENLLKATKEGSDEEVDALKVVMEAQKQLDDFKKKRAEEGSVYALREYDIQLEKLKELEKEMKKLSEKTGVDNPQLIDSMLDDSAWIRLARKKGVTDDELTQLKETNEEYTRQYELVKQLNELKIPKGGQSFDDDETSGYKRRIKYAKEYAETNQLLINSLEEQIRLREKLTKDEKAGLVEQMDAMQYNLEARQMIIKLEEEDQIRALEVWRANESKKLKANLESFKEGSAQFAQQAKQNRLQELENEKEYNQKLELIHQDRRMKEKRMNEKHDDDIKENIVNRYAVQKQLLVTEQAEHLKVLEDKLKTIRKGGNEEKQILFEIRQIQIDYHNLMIDNQIKQLKGEAEKVKTLGEQLELLKKIRELEAQRLPDAGEDYENKNSADGMGGSTVDSLFAQDFQKWSGLFQDFTNEMFGLADAIYEHRIALIQKEIDAEERKYDRLLELAKNDEEETKIIQRNKALALEKLEAKKRREQIKQAKLDKALKITQTIQNTAVAVVNALATSGPPWIGIAMAALVGAAGAVQLANIIATPIPSFATGGVMEKDGKALINDGGNQEYVERGGSILTTGKTNALVDLKEGDIIHKDFETLQRKSLLLSLSSGGESITEKELNLAFGIKEEIQKGFKNAQVNSKVTVLNEQNNYRDKMSLWGNS